MNLGNFYLTGRWGEEGRAEESEEQSPQTSCSQFSPDLGQSPRCSREKSSSSTYALVYLVLLRAFPPARRKSYKNTQKSPAPFPSFLGVMDRSASFLGAIIP